MRSAGNQAIGREYQKVGKPITQGEFGATRTALELKQRAGSISYGAITASPPKRARMSRHT